jgi:hypothetical protein
MSDTPSTGHSGREMLRLAVRASEAATTAWEYAHRTGAPPEIVTLLYRASSSSGKAIGKLRKSGL